MGVELILKDVRIAFTNGLWQARQFEGAGDFKFDGKFIIEPGSDNDKKIRAAILAETNKVWGDRAEVLREASQHSSKENCYIKGDLSGKDGMKGKMVLTAKRNINKGPVLVLDRAKNADGKWITLSAHDGRPYGGCFVNAKVEIYVQKGKFQGIRANLITVQFSKDGPAFGSGGPATDDGFEEIPTEEGGDDLM